MEGASIPLAFPPASLRSSICPNTTRRSPDTKPNHATFSIFVFTIKTREAIQTGIQA